MGLHALEEWHSVSGKLGWEGSTLLQPTAELAVVAGLSLLVGKYSSHFAPASLPCTLSTQQDSRPPIACYLLCPADSNV